MEKERGALRIAALDAAARRLGLGLGTALADARAIVPDLAVADIDRAADEACLRACADACERFTPMVALDGAEGLVLDVTGCAHLFGGEAGLVAAVERLFSRLGLAHRTALAGTPDAAHALARFGGGGIVAPGEEEAAVRPLPIAALEADLDTTIALTRAGLRSLGDVAERSAAGLAARFGAGLPRRLDRLLGREDVRISPRRPPPALLAERHFPEPLVGLDDLVEVVDHLIGEVCGRLEERGRGGRAFEASFFRVDGAVRRLLVETAGPTRERAAVTRLVRLKIDALADPLDPGFGFDAVRLAVGRDEPLALRQESLGEGPAATADGRAVLELVDRLVARFGRDNVLRFVARDSHDPVRAAAAVPHPEATTSTAWVAPQAGEPPTRPLTLFPHPQPIEVIAEVPDGPPIRFRWRRRVHEVARAEGPERIAPEWWRLGDTLPTTRDYYRVEDGEGHRFWLFREGLYEAGGERPRWFLHGLFA